MYMYMHMYMYMYNYAYITVNYKSVLIFDPPMYTCTYMSGSCCFETPFSDCNKITAITITNYNKIRVDTLETKLY